MRTCVRRTPSAPPGAVRTEPRAGARYSAGRPRAGATCRNARQRSREPDAFDVCKNNVSLAATKAVGPAPGKRSPSRRRSCCRRRCRASAPGSARCRAFAPRSGRSSAVAGSADVRHGWWLRRRRQVDGVIAGGELAVRAGFGLEGVIGEAGDGLVFSRSASAATSRRRTPSSRLARARAGGGLAAAVPSRIGIAARAADALLSDPRRPAAAVAAVLHLARERYQGMAVTAGNGGSDPVAGRLGDRDRPLPVRARARARRDLLRATASRTRRSWRRASPGASKPRVVDFRSIAFDLPILEYRPYRAFETNQSSSLLFQLFTGIDVPHSAKVVTPAGAPTPNLSTVCPSAFGYCSIGAHTRSARD